ncbi:hypothetical protein GCM10023168_34980 [Fodinibacter luteus]|uniref:DUF7282 domain-containing protein n=1 Tax=Fodinibacter luteus TaxID=552064 RepID=A0ABP8KQC8_9MICO
MTRTTHRATPTPALRLAALALVGPAALGLTGCGSEPGPESVGAPITLSSTPVGPGSSTTEPTAKPTASPSTAASTAAPGGAAPVPTLVRDDRADVDAEDQGGDGRSVRVSEVRLSVGTGHVVVVDPRTRQVLGSATVSSGTTRGVTVPLADPVTRSGELVVLLHTDDGDGRFDPATDGPVVDDDDLEPVDEDFDYRLR